MCPIRNGAPPREPLEPACTPLFSLDHRVALLGDSSSQRAQGFDLLFIPIRSLPCRNRPQHEAEVARLFAKVAVCFYYGLAHACAKQELKNK